MAKGMAQIDETGIVTNVLWYSDTQPDTERLKNVGDCPVGIGDEYREGRWYRDGEALLSPSEERIRELEREIEALKESSDTLTQCVLEMSEVVYA